MFLLFYKEVSSAASPSRCYKKWGQTHEEHRELNSPRGGLPLPNLLGATSEHAGAGGCRDKRKARCAHCAPHPTPLGNPHPTPPSGIGNSAGPAPLDRPRPTPEAPPLDTGGAVRASCRAKISVPRVSWRPQECARRPGLRVLHQIKSKARLAKGAQAPGAPRVTRGCWRPPAGAGGRRGICEVYRKLRTKAAQMSLRFWKPSCRVFRDVAIISQMFHAGAVNMRV